MDAVQLNLDPIDWDNYDTPKAGKSFTPPPQALDAEGKPIVYFGQVDAAFGDDMFKPTSDGALCVTVDPITLVNNGPGVDGTQLRFQRLYSTAYKDKDGTPLSASKLGNFLRSAQVANQFKPQTEDEYKAACRATQGRLVAFTLDWEVYDAQTKKSVLKGYKSFAGPNGAKDPFFVAPDGRKLVARAQIRNFVTA